jgi:hypothetical protein
MTSQQNAGEMPKTGPDVGQNLKGFPWVRLALAVFYALALWLVFWAVMLTTAAQFVFYLFSRMESQDLKAFAGGLARYAGQTVGYLTFVHNDRPFPFGPLPPT